jgi:enterochelin esterase family protein
MKRKLLLLIFSIAATHLAVAQRLTSQLDILYRALLIPDSTSRIQQAEKVWNDWVQNGKVPLIDGDSVAFIYHGPAKTVNWYGDFNRWGSDRDLKGNGVKIGSSDFWIFKTTFPRNARLDYKIVLDGHHYILDPSNPNVQWSGVGGGSPNSELRMPDWKPDNVQLHRSDVASGKIMHDLLIHSKALGYQVSYSVYLPHGYETMGKLPAVYVTDGYEYMHPQMGNMITVLDNLIADHRIAPLVAVFIDHREPVNRANNRRMEELAMSPKYLEFFINELIPAVEGKFPADPSSARRAIIGNSMGGLNSAYFVFSRPDVFSMAGIQSPAFYTRPQIYSLCEQSDGTPIKISMTSGLVHDASEGGRRMKVILEGNACKYTYREVNEGHSWGNWRNLVDDILLDFFASNP